MQNTCKTDAAIHLAACRSGSPELIAYQATITDDDSDGSVRKLSSVADRGSILGLAETENDPPVCSSDGTLAVQHHEIQPAPLSLPLNSLKPDTVRGEDSGLITAYRKAAQEVLPCLEQLDLSVSGSKPEYRHLPVTTDAVRLVSKLPSLTHLALDWRPVNLSTVEALADNLTRLAYISLDYCFCPRCAVILFMNGTAMASCSSSMAFASAYRAGSATHHPCGCSWEADSSCALQGRAWRAQAELALPWPLSGAARDEPAGLCIQLCHTSGIANVQPKFGTVASLT